MAISLANTSLDVPSDVRWVKSTLTFDDSYPTGGEAVAASDFGLREIHAVIVTGPTALGREARWIPSTGKIQVLNPAKIAAANLKTFKAAGAAAGNVTVTGVAATDTILSVLVLDRDATAANIDLLDLTSEFSVCAADTIGNAGGTSTSGNSLYVVVSRQTVTAAAEVASAGDLTGDSVELLVLGRK